MEFLEVLKEMTLFFFPGFVANGVPPVGEKIPLLRWSYVPIWPKLLGEHKTWGGFLSATLAGAAVAVIWIPMGTSYVYPSSNPLIIALIGASLGLGSAVGDSLGSILKRKLGYEPGKFVWFDLIDWLPGVWLVASLISWPGWIKILLTFLFGLPTFAVSFLFSRYTPLKESL